MEKNSSKVENLVCWDTYEIPISLEEVSKLLIDSAQAFHKSAEVGENEGIIGSTTFWKETINHLATGDKTHYLQEVEEFMLKNAGEEVDQILEKDPKELPSIW